MRETEIVLVQFIQPNAPYMSGETAGFPPAVAQRFVDRKRAVFVHPPPDPAPEPAAEVAPKPKPKAKPKAKPKSKKK